MGPGSYIVYFGGGLLALFHFTFGLWCYLELVAHKPHMGEERFWYV